MKQTRQIITRITKVITKQTKTDKDFLILEVENDADVYVFSWKLDKGFWTELTPNWVLGLTLEPSKEGHNLLTAVNLHPFKKNQNKDVNK